MEKKYEALFLDLIHLYDTKMTEQQKLWYLEIIEDGQDSPTLSQQCLIKKDILNYATSKGPKNT